MLATAESTQKAPLATFFITQDNVVISVSFKQYALAPILNEFLVSSSLSCAVKIIILVFGETFFIISIASNPFIPGKPKSMRTTSGLSFLIISIPSLAFCASAAISIPSTFSKEHLKPTLVSL